MTSNRMLPKHLKRKKREEKKGRKKERKREKICEILILRKSVSIEK